MAKKSILTQQIPNSEDLLRQINELTDALQRERADVINVRRRHDEQLASVKTVLKVQIVEELLPVIDNFERALKHIPKEIEETDFVNGVKGIVKQFEKTLTDLGVERIQTIGQSFDPSLHEAVGSEDGSGDKEVVVEELQSGYRLGDSIIRHAMVKVKR